MNELEKKLSLITPKQNDKIEKNISLIESDSEIFYDNNIPKSALYHLEDINPLEGGKVKLSTGLKKDIIDDLTLLNPKGLIDGQEEFKQGVLEDFLIEKKIIKRDDDIFGTIEFENKTVPRRLADIEEKIIRRLLNNLLRFMSPEDIKKEVLIKDRKVALKTLLLSTNEYSRYRHKFITEMYSNILASLPKLMKTTYGVGFLREAFMVIHVLYKYGDNSESLDPLALAEIICESNAILPSSQLYDKDFTVEFFLDLAGEGVFKKIQKLCNEDILSTQLTDMTTFVSQRMDEMRIKSKEAGFETRDLKDLTDMLSRIQSISLSLETTAQNNNITYIYNDESVGIDYSKLASLVETDPDKFTPFDFKYYIQCYDENEDGQEVFKGWLIYDVVKRDYCSSNEGIKVWDIKREDKQALIEFQNILSNIRLNGEHKTYKVKKMYNNERTLEGII